MIFYALIIFAALGGFLLAFYIHHKKYAREVLVCPLGSNCDAVIQSEFSRFFGVPVELLGMAYYGIIAVGYGAFLILPSIARPEVIFAFLVLTTAAFLFSLYLTFIQAFALRQWCTWCLTSAGLCTFIFFSVVVGSELGLFSILSQHREIILILHAFGAALGVGGATISDIFFFKSLKDFRISEWEAGTLHLLSQVIWFALAVIVVTGLGLYLPDTDRLNESSKFLAKMVIVGALMVNGAFLNLFISPKLIRITFGRTHQHEEGELRRLRKTAFALGAVSLISWYSAFILGSLRALPLGFGTILGIYAALVIAAVVGSQIAERVLVRRAEDGYNK